MALSRNFFMLKSNNFFSENIFNKIKYIGTFGTSRNNTVESQKPIENSSETINTDDSTKLQIDTNKLTKELAELNEKNKDLLDKYKRALAEGENVRQRFMKQASEAKLFGIQGFCKDLLDVADILNKATETVPKEEISDQNPHLKNLYEGLVMTEAKLQSVFKRHGLESVTPLNQKFDPNFHEALFQQEIEGKESGTVISVTKIGYKLHDRVIRPALVGVAK